MLQNLPGEIIINIYKYLDFRDICCLQLTNSAIYSKICDVSDYIITQELRKFDKQTCKQSVYFALTYFTGIYYTRCQNDRLINISNNEHINAIFADVFEHYLHEQTLETYPNKIILFMLYNLIQIDVYQNVQNVNYNVKLLESFSASSLYIIRRYGNFLLSNNIPMRIDTYTRLSRFIVTVPILKKLFGIRELDLDQTILLKCSSECISLNLCDIVVFKYNRYNDNFLRRNYRKIKTFLQKHNPDYADMMETYETTIINRHITFYDPITFDRYRLNENVAHDYLHRLRYELPSARHICRSLENYIYKKQRRLRRKYF